MPPEVRLGNYSVGPGSLFDPVALFFAPLAWLRALRKRWARDELSRRVLCKAGRRTQPRTRGRK